MHLKNAIDCISDNDFEEAKNIVINFLEVDSSAIVEAYPILKKINDKNKIKNFSYYTNLYLIELKNNSNRSFHFQIYFLQDS